MFIVISLAINPKCLAWMKILGIKRSDRLWLIDMQNQWKLCSWKPNVCLRIFEGHENYIASDWCGAQWSGLARPGPPPKLFSDPRLFYDCGRLISPLLQL